MRERPICGWKVDRRTGHGLGERPISLWYMAIANSDGPHPESIKRPAGRRFDDSQPGCSRHHGLESWARENRLDGFPRNLSTEFAPVRGASTVNCPWRSFHNQIERTYGCDAIVDTLSAVVI